MSGHAGNQNFAFSSSVIKDGLVLYLDATSSLLSSSYGVAGDNANWYSVAGTNGVLVNNPVYTGSYGGGMVFNGSNNYATINLNLSSTNYTIIAACKVLTLTSGRSIGGINNNWLMGHYSTNTVGYYAEGWVINATGSNDTNWRIYTATGNISGDSYALYVNGVLVAAANGNGSQGPNGICLGGDLQYNEFSNSQIGFIMVYNRVLSSTEITTIYSGSKARFGL
jgi:hypothetical protein